MDLFDGQWLNADPTDTSVIQTQGAESPLNASWTVTLREEITVMTKEKKQDSYM